MDKFFQGKYTCVNIPRVRLPFVKLPRVSLPSLILPSSTYCGQSYTWKTCLGKVTREKLPQLSYPGKATLRCTRPPQSQSGAIF